MARFEVMIDNGEYEQTIYIDGVKKVKELPRKEVRSILSPHRLLYTVPIIALDRHTTIEFGSHEKVVSIEKVVG